MAHFTSLSICSLCHNEICANGATECDDCHARYTIHTQDLALPPVSPWTRRQPQHSAGFYLGVAAAWFVVVAVAVLFVLALDKLFG